MAAPQTVALTLSPPKESPPINRNDPSPVSTVHNEIVGPILISPEIDEDNEEENDLGPIINDKRRLILILEKLDAKVDCDEEEEQEEGDEGRGKGVGQGEEGEEDEEESREMIATIDLSSDTCTDGERNDDIVETKKNRNVFLAMEDRGDRSMEVVIAEENVHDGAYSPSISNQPVLTNSEDSLASTNSECFSEPSKIKEFVLPANVKESDKPPTLSRISSQEDNALISHLDDSSTSFNLPADISQTEEFKSFYNDGNVFNSITTSQTDSSEKDADESLLSVSNSNSYGISDLELNGAYSCDSSICYNLRPRLRSSKLEEDLFENPLRCSPGQSDLVQNHVSSTTPFVSPSIIEKEEMVTTVHSDEGNSSTKCELTFEDIGFINDDSIVDSMNKEDSMGGCGTAEEDGIMKIGGGGMKNEEGGKPAADPVKEVDMKVGGGDQQGQVDVDIVSSSLNETSIISDSSL